jgi:hypothetical protein
MDNFRSSVYLFSLLLSHGLTLYIDNPTTLSFRNSHITVLVYLSRPIFILRRHFPQKLCMHLCSIYVCSFEYHVLAVYCIHVYQIPFSQFLFAFSLEKGSRMISIYCKSLYR